MPQRFLIVDWRRERPGFEIDLNRDAIRTPGGERNSGEGIYRTQKPIKPWVYKLTFDQ